MGSQPTAEGLVKELSIQISGLVVAATSATRWFPVSATQGSYSPIVTPFGPENPLRR